MRQGDHNAPPFSLVHNVQGDHNVHPFSLVHSGLPPVRKALIVKTGSRVGEG